MRQDVIDALSGKFPNRIPSKETLNHPGIIKHITGLDVFEDTRRAFEIAWRKLGIDIHVPLPEKNTSKPKVPGGTWQEDNLRFSDMGVYPTTALIEYCPGLEKNNWDWIFQYDASKDGFTSSEYLSKLPESLLHASFRKPGGLQGEGKLGTAEQLAQISRDFNNHFGDKSVMYHLYYTTLFMWPVVTFGWENFMTAAALEPEKFDECFWQPWSKASREYFEAAAQLPDEVIFCHDDLVMTTGPVFAPDFYDKYIFSRYEYILEPVIQAGKKIVFVCDGNLDVFLERLLDFPFAGIMFENPATPFDHVLQTWGKAGRGFLGGIATEVLTNGTPGEVRTHTKEVIEKGKRYPGFIISSCGGLHSNIPMENMIAYFEARNSCGISTNI